MIRRPTLYQPLPHDRCRRAGLSTLQFVGCLAALAGGAWLGAIYVGADLWQVAYVALDESSLLEKIPEEWRPVDPQAAENAPSPAEQAQAVQEELADLRRAVGALRTDPRGGGTNSAESSGNDAESPGAGTEQSTRVATIAYWNQLHDAMRDAQALQLDAELGATRYNATKIAALKGRISRFAGNAIQIIATEHVDPTAVGVARELAQWYERGGSLYDEAVRIWESTARHQGGSQLSKEWEQASQQHRNEGRLLNQKVAALRDSLIRRFGNGFAELAAL